MSKTGILLVNLGTPDSPETSDVRKYLAEFLNDERVIDISAVQRKLLVNFIIAPTRAPKSAAQYKEVWTKEGSPLLLHGIKLKNKLQKHLGHNYIVELAMRYQLPSLKKVLDKLTHDSHIEKLIVVPLYPHYASSSTGSTIKKVMELLLNKEVIPATSIVGPFFNNPHYIDAFVKIILKQFNLQEYDHFLFSYHGLPERHIMKGSAQCGMNCRLGDCCKTFSDKNFYCYRAECFETTRLLVAALNLKEGTYSSTFQSRLGRDPWIKPYTDKAIEELAKKGVKKILAFSPAFVADCLETLYEIRIEYNRLFQEHGGTHLHLAESLNDNDEWVKALGEIILK
ncbi:MAG: ferrochelatase [Bacteroidia bacterium]